MSVWRDEALAGETGRFGDSMKIVFRTRSPFPLYRILLFFLLAVGSSYYYFLHNAKPPATAPRPTMMAIAPIIPDIQIIQPPVTLTTLTLPIPKNETFSD